MISEALTEGLERYDIGAKVRTLRLGRKLGLAQLGAHTGLSTGMLSKIERGQLFPTLPTLLRIAMVFGVGLEHFFVGPDQPQVAIVRKADRLRLPDRVDGPPTYFFESLDFPVSDRQMEAYYAEFESATPSDPHTHPGAEIIYVIAGGLEIDVEGSSHVLETGDSMYFDCTRPHAYRRHGTETCRAIVTVTRRKA